MNSYHGEMYAFVCICHASGMALDMAMSGHHIGLNRFPLKLNRPKRMNPYDFGYP